MNLLNVGKRDCKHIKTVEKVFPVVYRCIEVHCTCSCCGQLWYKHSVVNAEGPRVPNPNAGEYLVSKNVSRTLSGSVSLVIKIPYSAAKNGMSFPVNPVFFYLKQLEYRLTAPTISYKIVDTFTFLTPYFVTVIPFCPPSLSVQPPSPQGKAMLCHNCCDLGEQTSNIEGGSGVLSTFFFSR